MRTGSQRVVIAVLVGVAAFAGISIYADVSELGARLSGFHWWAFAAALALALVNYGLRFVRWTLYLRAVEVQVPTATSALVFLSGFALSITPGKVGELLKSYLLRETHDVPLARSAPVVVAERVTDLLALLALGLIGVWTYGIARDLVLAGTAVVATGLVVLAWPTLANGVFNLLGRISRLSGLVDRLREFYRALATLSRPAHLAWSIPLAAAAWLAECIGFAVIIGGFPGTDVPVGLATLIYASTTVAGALSFLPGGLLVTEAAMTLFLVEAARGVDEPTAAAATILTRLATLWFAVVIGAAALAWLRRRHPRAARAAEKVTD